MTHPFLDEASGEQAMNPTEGVIINRTVVTSPAEVSQLPQELNGCSGGGTEAQGLTEARRGQERPAESQAHRGT